MLVSGPRPTAGLDADPYRTYRQTTEGEVELETKKAGEVRVNAENPSHSKYFAALNPCDSELSFQYAMKLSPLRAKSKGGR